MKRKTTLEILEETVAYYSVPGRRAIDSLFSASVYYNEEDGNKCAVGRVMVPEVIARHRIFEGYGLGGYFFENTVIKELGKNSLDECLKKEYRGHDRLFWKVLQDLHDKQWNWKIEGGLSETGKLKVKEIIELFCKNENNQTNTELDQPKDLGSTSISDKENFNSPFWDRLLQESFIPASIEPVAQ